jgi:CSLREA domain-containing protein
MKFAALFGAVFSKKSERHQKASLLPCREAKQHEARHHEARHYKKVGLSAFVAAMLCMGVAAQAATITVNSAVDALTDGGNCTLRGAVNAINAGSDRNNCVAVVSPDAYGSNDTITFDAAVFATPTTIDVTASGEIVITRSLTIEGLLDVDDAPLITLDGKSANRILNVSSAVSVLAVSGLAFQNGSVAGYSDGGAISANGSSTTVIVRNSTFENNQAAHYGGAIYARNNVNISASTFEGNQSIGDGGGAI